MKYVPGVLAPFLVFLACIGWNGRQREVVSAYNLIRTNTQDEDWEDLLESFTEESQAMLEEMARALTASGVPFENDPETLLEAMAVETDILLFPGTILSVEFSGGYAVLTAEEGGKPFSYRFQRESGQWRMDLTPGVNDLMAEATRGLPEAPATGTAGAVPSFISQGEGPCTILIRNRLRGIALHNVFCSLSTSDSWGPDHLGRSILGTDSELALNVEAGVYDIQIYDSMERSYTLWQVEITENGALWEVTEADLDPPE